MVWSWRIIRVLKQINRQEQHRQNMSNFQQNHVSRTKTGTTRYIRNDAHPSSLKKKLLPSDTGHRSEECAPLKSLPATPRDDNDSAPQGARTQSSVTTNIVRHDVSDEKTHFGHVINGNVQQTSNISGNVVVNRSIEFPED